MFKGDLLVAKVINMETGASPAREVFNFPSEPLVDQSGVPFPRRSWMARIDSKGEEQVTLRRSTLWFVGTLIAVVPILIILGALLISYGRDDGTRNSALEQVQTQQKETREDVKELNRKFDEIQKMLNDQRVQNAKSEGVKIGVMAAEDPKKK